MYPSCEIRVSPWSCAPPTNPARGSTAPPPANPARGISGNLRIPDTPGSVQPTGLSADPVLRTLVFMQVDYIDPRSGATFPLGQPRWCGPDRTPLLLTPLPGLTRAQIDTGLRSLWRYRAAFPLAVEQPITLGEGCTPL